MDKVLESLAITIIDDSVKKFYQQIFPIIPNIFLLKSPTSNYFDFINSISDTALLTALKQIDLLSLNSRLKSLLYYDSNSINTCIIFNQKLLMLWLTITIINDIVIKHQTNGSTLLILSPENILRTNVLHGQTQVIDIGILKYKTQISVIQMNKVTSQLLINGSEIEIMDVIKNILTN